MIFLPSRFFIKGQWTVIPNVLDIFNIIEKNVIAWFRHQFLNYWTNFQKNSHVKCHMIY